MNHVFSGWMAITILLHQIQPGVLDTPILLELKAILEHSIKNHVILIDDARCFIGSNPILRNYPTIDQLKEFVARRWNNFSFEVKDDIIRIILL